MDFYTLTFDASCPQNPGNRAFYGFTIYHFAELSYSGSGGLAGENLDNNISEFFSVVKGLEAINNRVSGPAILNIKGDSALVLNFLKKKWKMKKDKPFYQIYKKAEGLLTKLRKRGIDISFTWIPRDLNQECHDLAQKVKKGLDK